MRFQSLVDERLISQLPGPSPKQADARLRAAHRDLAAASAIADASSDWAYRIAYNAALQAGRALMFHMGYRPTSGEGAHVAVVRFLAEILSTELPEEVDLFETMRRKRHRAVYDQVGAVGKKEVEAARDTSLKIYDAVRKIITGTRQLDLDP